MNDMVSSRKTGGLAWSVTLQSVSAASANEHAISIAEKTVLLPDRVGIGAQNAFAPGKSAHQHQETRLRQMKVGEQSAYQAELEAGRDEDFRRAGVRLNFSACDLERTVLQRTHHCGANGHNAPAFTGGTSHRISSLRGERIALAVKVNIIY